MLPGNRDIDPIIRIIGSGWIPSVQRQAGLGAALVDVFLAAFDGNADRAVAVAGDAPALPPSHIAAAYRELRAGTNAGTFVAPFVFRFASIIQSVARQNLCHERRTLRGVSQDFLTSPRRVRPLADTAGRLRMGNEGDRSERHPGV